MKKFFYQGPANMVEKEIATEFLLRECQIVDRMSNCRSRMAGAGRTLRSVINKKIVYGKCWSEHISDETMLIGSRMKRITMLEKLSVLSEKLSFSGSSVRCGLSGSVRLKHTIRQISGLLCPATM